MRMAYYIAQKAGEGLFEVLKGRIAAAEQPAPL